jgi:hypothetical protein
MTVSGVHTFNMNQSELIEEATHLTGEVDVGTVVEKPIYASCVRSLNMYSKSWQSKGLFLHTYKPATLFLSADQQSYLLGPDGDHATESYVETTLSGDVASGAGSVTLTSTTGITTGDHIGIILDDSSIFWSTITLPGTLAANITGAASSGNVVYTYTDKIIRPLKIADVRHLSGTVERPIDVVSVSEYMSLTNKDSASQPVKCCHDPQLDNTRLYVWPVANDGQQRLVFNYKKPVDDFNGDSVTAAIPADWLQCFTLGLAYTIAPKLSVSLDKQAALKVRYDEALMDIDDFEEASIYFAPARRGM